MSLSRRSFLTASGLAVSAGLTVPTSARALSSTGLSSGSSLFQGFLPSRPEITHGVATGDMRADGALVWTRSDRPARMVVETAATEDFNNARRFVAKQALTPETDGTGRVRLTGLEAGQDVHYRVTLEDLTTGAASEPVTGTFRTAPAGEEDIRFHWSADVAGQGYGINPDMDGMIGWSAMAARSPQFFLHSGDSVYSDNPIEAEVKLEDGRIWRNITSDAKSKVAETLDEFRGQYAYNLMDKHYLEFNRQVPQLMQWDDHEVSNNWYPGEILDDPRYTIEKNADVLSARGFQAFHEWQPLDSTMAVDGRIYRKVSYGPLLDIFILDMRTYKDENDKHHAGDNEYGWILGDKQRDWLINEVKNSTATWKVIANDLPLGIIMPDGDNQEGVSSGTPGEPVGREQELAHVLTAFKDIKNVVWLTADVHYCAAHEYDPNKAAYQDFAPFWEFVSGPLHAGGFGPNEMDPTFGPRVDFFHGPDYVNQSPLDDIQHFGEVDINAETKEFTVRFITTRGNVLYTKTLPAA
ncbi:alkaline phosphatase D family protein [Corynebacterium breve]|uniref:Alkaline phosphatase D family protein n=1 Tax=Corynebacterium breve TaxID=3049799 RepID=A0ABY8VH16_9CORY|nr:alkaline phosphatase D family protein [Corynebacterium breve]WIM68241.1 alkaline phosphatase D family protein [Corynebacterium breve]